MQAREQEVEVSGPGGTKMRLKNYRMGDIVAYFGTCLLIGMSAMLYYHIEGTKDSNVQLVIALNKMAAAVSLQTCVLAVPQESRWNQFSGENSYCARASR